MCKTLEAADWRGNLERGIITDAIADRCWKLAALPIQDDGEPFTDLMLRCDARMMEIVRRFLETGNTARWYADMTDLLFEFHTLAHLIGQNGLGIRSLAHQRAFQVMNLGAGLAGPEIDFLFGFLRDLENRDKRYWTDGEIDGDEVLRRMRMYQGKMRGTAGWGFVDPLPPQEEIWWVLGGAEDHCPDCPYNAEVNPWSKQTLYTTPGGGDTPCLFNCLCHLETKAASSVLPVERAA